MMYRYVFFLLGFGLLSSSTLAAEVDRFTPLYAITDVKVVAEPRKVLDHATVLIQNGLIQKVTTEKMDIPANAIRMEGKNWIVYPGWIDAFCTRAYDAALKRSEGGPPANEDLNSDPLIATKPDHRRGLTPEFIVANALKLTDDTIAPWRKIGCAVQCIAPEMGFFNGQSCVVNLSGKPQRESLLRKTFAQQASFRMLPGTEYPRALMGIFAHCRQTLLDVGYHQRRVQAFEQGKWKDQKPPFDPCLESLQPVLAGKMPMAFEADSADEILRVLSFANEFKIKPIIVGGRDAWKVAEELKKTNTPLILKIDFAEPSDREKELPNRVKEEKDRKRKEEIRNAKVLHEKGVAFSFSAQGLTPEKFRDQLRKIHKEGLPFEVVLEALTTNPAKLFGVDGILGKIAEKQAANVVIATGDLLESKTEFPFVFVDGVRFEAEKPEETPSKDKEKKDEPKQPKQEEPKTNPVEPKKGPEPKTLPKDDSVSVILESDLKPALQTKGNVLIRNATVITVSKAGTIEKADLLIQNGKIASIGPADSVKDYKGTIVDATGMFIMPGIIDTHAHFAISGGVNEFSLSVVPEVQVLDVIDSEDIAIYRALAGGVTTARLLHGSANVIGGQHAVIKLKYGLNARQLAIADAPRGVKCALGENVKRSDGRFPNSRLGVEAVLIRSFSEAQVYQKQWEDYRHNPDKNPEPRRDLRLEALSDMLKNDLKIHCHCYRSDEILMLLRVAEKFGIKIQSLQHVLEGYKVAPEIAAHGASCSLFADWWAYKLEAFDAIPYAAALLNQAGAKVCLKSDSNELTRHLYQEAAKCIKYGGMSEGDAFKTITLHPAQQLGLDQRIGSIEVGKDADITLFNGHPMNSYSRCEMTLVEGEVYFQRAKNFTPTQIAKVGPTKPTTEWKPIPKDSNSSYLLRHPIVHLPNGSSPKVAGLLVSNGKIAAIFEKEDDLPKFNGTVIDLKGYHVYPGMIDTATVLGLTELGSAKETQDFADGGDFQPDLRASTAINPDSELIPVTRANGVLSVLTRPTGPIVGGQGALINLSGWTPKEMTVIDPLGLHVEFPSLSAFFSGEASFPMIGRALVKKQRQEKIRALKDLFQEANRYNAARQTNSNIVMVPRLQAMLPYARGDKPVIIQAYRKTEIEDAIKLADELKIKIILSGALDAWKVTEELKKRNIPVLVGPTLSLPLETYDSYDAPYACPAKLHQAGVRFAIRSLGSNNTRNLPYEAAMAVSYGLPPEVALKAVTSSAAEILGVADQLGSIEAGKRANLVITNGDLLQASTQVLGLFIDGKPIDPSNKQTRLYDKYRERLQEFKQGRVPLGTK